MWPATDKCFSLTKAKSKFLIDFIEVVRLLPNLRQEGLPLLGRQCRVHSLSRAAGLSQQSVSDCGDLPVVGWHSRFPLIPVFAISRGQ